jgi:uncharacterized membrane protein YesL
MADQPAPLHTRAWRNFRRMQLSGCLFAALIYMLAVLHAWEALPGAPRMKAYFFLLFPAVFFLFTFVVPLSAGPIRRMLKRYVWMSFAAGFGQNVVSVVGGLGVLALTAGFIFLQIAGHEDGGRYPAGIFSAYAAGVGVLFAQAVLTRWLEREPEVRALIER